MKTLHNNYCNSKQGYLPLFLSDCLDLLDPVLTFDRLMGGIDLNKYLTDIPEYTTGRLRYNPVNMLKTVLVGFMTSGYCSLRELEDNCKVNIRFMYLMDHQTPSYRTFGYFINEILQDKIENIFNDINHAIFNDEHVDLQHFYIDGSKFEANANKYTWVWKKATEKFRYKLYEKITAEIEEINAEIAWTCTSFASTISTPRPTFFALSASVCSFFKCASVLPSRKLPFCVYSTSTPSSSESVGHIC